MVGLVEGGRRGKGVDFRVNIVSLRRTIPIGKYLSKRINVSNCLGKLTHSCYI